MPQGLDWGRLDAGWPQHPKFLRLAAERQWRTITVYWAALAYAVRQGTDGWVDPVVLPLVFATRREAGVLVECGLWDVAPDRRGWLIHDFAEYQQTTAVTLARRDQAARAAAVRWNGHDRTAR